MSDVHYWRVYCSTDSKDEYEWSETEPTTCPTNTAHTIDSSKTRITKTISENIVQIREGSDEINGHYRSSIYNMQMPETKATLGGILSPITAGDTIIDVEPANIASFDLDYYISAKEGTTSGLLGKVNIVDYTNSKVHLEGDGALHNYSTSGTTIELNTIYRDFIHPYNVGVMSYSFISDTVHKNDGGDVHVYPQKIVGALSANASTGSTVLNVTSTVTDNIKVGFLCRLTDGTKKECLGHVLDVDTVNNQITVQKPLVHSFSASSPTYVMLSVIMLRGEKFGHPGPHQLGLDKVGSSLIRKNETVRVFYNEFSDSQSDKDFTFYVGHLY